MGALFLIILLFIVTLPFLSNFRGRYKWFDVGLMQGLYWYHMLFALIYYMYVQSSASDSVAYFNRAQNDYLSWMEIYGTGTPFIDFVAYPFVNYLGFSYEMMMALFAYMGYWGFVYFYIVFKENIQHKHYWQGFSLITLIIFLPNMHYWTASLGKGSIIFLGLSMSIYGLSRMKHRILSLLAGLLIVYHVRPHVFFLMAVGILIGIMTGKHKVPLYQKILVFAGTAGAVMFLYNDIMSFANLDTENLFSSFDELSSHRASELAKSGSGVDISNYPLPFKLFTFWFRPLFIDAPGPIGLIVSFENLFCLFLALQLFNTRFIRYMATSPALVKINAVVLLAVSFALSGTLSNLGIIIRQKSMVMYFLLFIILSFLDHQKNSYARNIHYIARL